MNEKITAHPQKEEREKVLKEIRQLENRKKILENKQRNEERRVRTRRLIERGAVLEGIFPLAPDLSGAEVKAFLIALSHLPGAAELTENMQKSWATPIFQCFKGRTVAGVVRPAGGCCALRARWGATLPKPLVRSAQPDTHFAFVRLHRACYPLTERRCSP